MWTMLSPKGAKYQNQYVLIKKSSNLSQKFSADVVPSLFSAPNALRSHWSFAPAPLNRGPSGTRRWSDCFFVGWRWWKPLLLCQKVLPYYTMLSRKRCLKDQMRGLCTSWVVSTELMDEIVAVSLHWNKKFQKVTTIDVSTSFSHKRVQASGIFHVSVHSSTSSSPSLTAFTAASDKVTIRR